MVARLVLEIKTFASGRWVYHAHIYFFLTTATLLSPIKSWIKQTRTNRKANVAHDYRPHAEVYGWMHAARKLGELAHINKGRPRKKKEKHSCLHISAKSRRNKSMLFPQRF